MVGTVCSFGHSCGRRNRRRAGANEQNKIRRVSRGPDADVEQLVVGPQTGPVARPRGNRARPRHHPQTRPHDGRRRHGDERTGQRLSLHGAAAGRGRYL